MIETQHKQRKALANFEALTLPRLQVSPYYNLGRGANKILVMKVIFEQFIASGNPDIYYAAAYMSGATVVETSTRQVPLSAYTTSADVISAVEGDILSYATGQGYTITAADIVWVGASAAGGIPVESALSLSLQTSTGAVGTQVSATQDAWVMITGNPISTASIAGNASADIAVEVAPTNSATAGDWVEKGRLGNAQALSLAITLQSVQTTKAQIVAFVPKGYYVKARQIGSGTTSFSLGAVRKVLI